MDGVGKRGTVAAQVDGVGERGTVAPVERLSLPDQGLHPTGDGVWGETHG